MSDTYKICFLGYKKLGELAHQVIEHLNYSDTTIILKECSIETLVQAVNEAISEGCQVFVAGSANAEEFKRRFYEHLIELHIDMSDYLYCLQRAKELGMNDTTFKNATGLPARGHVTSAYDIALMSRELILHHPGIRQYTTIWMDSLRDGASELVNTNKLIRFFDGATGLKTGSTDSALYCLSGTAERDGMELIAVIMKDATSAQRFEDAKTLLSYGFSTYSLEHVTPQEALPPVTVRLGTQATVQPVLEEGSALLLEKSKAGTLEQSVSLAEAVEAPVAKGTPLGTLTITSGEETVAELALVAGEEIPRITFGQMLLRVLQTAFLAG